MIIVEGFVGICFCGSLEVFLCICFVNLLLSDDNSKLLYHFLDQRFMSYIRIFIGGRVETGDEAQISAAKTIILETIYIYQIFIFFYLGENIDKP